MRNEKARRGSSGRISRTAQDVRAVRVHYGT